MQRFHRAMSLTLLLLASVILVTETVRASGLYPRLVLGTVLAAFCIVMWRLGTAMRAGRADTRMGV